MGTEGMRNTMADEFLCDTIEVRNFIGAVKEIRSIYNLSVYGRRRIVELPIPGSVGNVFQDMGRNPLVISFDGELVGPNAASILQNIASKFELKKPVPFSCDITPIDGITEVIVEDFAVHFAGGINLGVRYSIVLKEQASASTGGKRGPGETEPPSQEESSKKEIQQRIKSNVYGRNNPKALSESITNGNTCFSNPVSFYVFLELRKYIFFFGFSFHPSIWRSFRIVASPSVKTNKPSRKSTSSEPTEAKRSH
jgi:hypothetical protein